MTGIKICLATAVAAELIPTAGAIEKLGVVGLLVVAIGFIWREGAKRQDKLEKIIASNTEALTKNADASAAAVDSMKEVTQAIIHCRDRDAGILQGIQGVQGRQGVHG